MKILLIALSFVICLSGLAFARGEYAPEHVRRGGMHMAPYRGMPDDTRGYSAPKRGGAAQQNDRRAKKGPNPYDSRYDSNYRPRF